jgi:hypothetical protein
MAKQAIVANTALPCGHNKAENSSFSVNCEVLKNLMQTIASPRVLQSTIIKLVKHNLEQ